MSQNITDHYLRECVCVCVCGGGGGSYRPTANTDTKNDCPESAARGCDLPIYEKQKQKQKLDWPTFQDIKR